MKHLSAILLLLAISSPAHADTLFESGTLGPTGVPQGAVAASNVNANVFVGVRFQLTQPIKTTQIGGHFVSSSGGDFFGAIIELENENDFPNSGDLSTPDVLGNAELEFPILSDEVYGDLELTLYPGWYALVFGSGLFGITGDGAAPLNNPDIGSPEFIAYQPGSGWNSLSGFLSDFRFVVDGKVIPEPSSITFTSIGIVLFMTRMTRDRR